MKELNKRRAFSHDRLDKFRSELSESEGLALGKACVYATGSFGRGEGCSHSDLDVFIAAKVCNDSGGQNSSMLNRLDEICIKAELIKVSQKNKFPPFTREGHYLTHHTTHDFTKSLGRPEDDYTNSFTARLLLILESVPLVGKQVHQEIASDIITAYWRDYEDHSDSFMPAFLANDILRLWRTFCVNYEAFSDKTPEMKKAKRKLKNYKLKHSRLMTCYSAILQMLTLYRKNGTVTPKDAMIIFNLAPTTRIEELASTFFVKDAKNDLNKLLLQYEKFLVSTNAPEDDILDKFMDNQKSKELMSDSNEFGDTMYKCLKTIGNGSPFHRMLVV